jgi:hypothetical protein
MQMNDTPPPHTSKKLFDVVTYTNMAAVEMGATLWRIADTHCICAGAPRYYGYRRKLQHETLQRQNPLYKRTEHYFII